MFVVKIKSNQDISMKIKTKKRDVKKLHLETSDRLKIKVIILVSIKY